MNILKGGMQVVKPEILPLWNWILGYFRNTDNLIRDLQRSNFYTVSGLDDTVARAVLLPVAIAYTLIVAYLFLKHVQIDYTQRDSIFLGLMWLVLTIIFEFSFGTFVIGYSLATLLYDYNIFAGRTWVLFLLTTAIAPFVVHKYILQKAQQSRPNIFHIIV